MAREIDRDEAQARIAAGAALLDAQGPGKFEREHIAGAMRGRIDDPEMTIALLGDDLDRQIVVYCTDRDCTGSALAAKLLEGRGYRNVLRYTNGLSDWADAGLPVDTSDLPPD
jgi:rhodanese-related sulfurtransferase